MKQKVKIAAVVVLAAGLAAAGAAWKWQASTVKPSPPHKIAGWSWGTGHAKASHVDDGGGSGD